MPIVLIEKESHHAYTAISAMPELKLGLSVDDDDRFRIEGSARWSKYTALVDAKEVAASRVSGQPIIGMLAMSFRVSGATTRKEGVSTAVERISFGLGYGNLPIENEKLVTGTVFMLSLEADLIAYNF